MMISRKKHKREKVLDRTREFFFKRFELCWFRFVGSSYLQQCHLFFVFSYSQGFFLFSHIFFHFYRSLGYRVAFTKKKTKKVFLKNEGPGYLIKEVQQFTALQVSQHTSAKALMVSGSQNGWH